MIERYSNKRWRPIPTFHFEEGEGQIKLMWFWETRDLVRKEVKRLKIGEGERLRIVKYKRQEP